MKVASKIMVIFLVNILLILFTSGVVADDKKTLETILSEWSLHDVRQTREQLENLVKNNPKNYVAWYWIAVASHRDLDDSTRAKAALSKIIKAQPKQPTWLMPWAYFRLGMVANSEGQTSEAIKLFNKVLLFKDDGSGFYYAAQDELSKLEN